MSKMGSHDPFEYLKHKLWPREGPQKVRNHPEIHACRWHATYCWKELNKGYNFALNITSIKGLHKKLWPSKVPGIPIL
jgi:hypothetical protein